MSESQYLASFVTSKFVDIPRRPHSDLSKCTKYTCISLKLILFSSFVTIPPSSWTNSAHRHSVLCLGTMITEGEKGYLICLEMLKNNAEVGRAVDQLLAVMQYYNFDGWLINIENQLPGSMIDRMVDFLRQVGLNKLNEIQSGV